MNGANAPTTDMSPNQLPVVFSGDDANYGARGGSLVWGSGSAALHGAEEEGSEPPMRNRAAHRPAAALVNPAAIYATGLLGMGYNDLYIFLIPLYALSLGMSAEEIGALAGARHLLPVFLSIHIGVLMDRFGTRRVSLFLSGWRSRWPRCFRFCRGSGR